MRGRAFRAATFALGGAGLGVAVAWARVIYHRTPISVAKLMARLLDPGPGTEVCDPGCGSGPLLIGMHRTLAAAGDGARARLYGQEIRPFPLAMARLHARLQGLDARLEGGDSIRSPAFVDNGSLKRFDLIVANPMWEQPVESSVYENDPFGRFTFGHPPARSADWGWLQHMHASLKDNGRMAVILDAEVTSRGEGSDPEGALRRAFVDADLIEAVICCSPAAGGGALPRARAALLSWVLTQGVILVVNRRRRRPGEILFLDGVPLLREYCEGRLTSEQAVDRVVDAYSGWRAVPGLSHVATSAEVAGRGYDLSPRAYIGG